MNKAEIIKLLDQEVSLFDTTEDENSLGELYITEKQFKEAETVLGELSIIRDKVAKQEARLREVIESDKRFTVLKDNRGSLNDMELWGVLQTPYIAIDSMIYVHNCSFIGETDKGLSEEILDGE